MDLVQESMNSRSLDDIYDNYRDLTEDQRRDILFPEYRQAPPVIQLTEAERIDFLEYVQTIDSEDISSLTKGQTRRTAPANLEYEAEMYGGRFK